MEGKMKCEDCFFYQREQDWAGECRRHAPRPQLDCEIAVWPIVKADDWCGEYDWRGYAGAESE